MSRDPLDRSFADSPAARPRARALLAAVLLSTACRGPSLQVDSDDPVHRDGTRIRTGESMPFRYYGTTVLDTVPRDQKDRPDFTRVAARTEVEIPMPVSPWIFPFDFLVELAQQPFGAAADQRVEVHSAPAPTQVSQGFQPEGLEPLRTRAFAARSSR